MRLQMLTGPTSDGKKFDIIMDCTSYTPSSEVPMQWFKFFIELLPVDVRQHFGTARLLNSNLAILRFLRKLYVICSGKLHASLFI
jgi:neurofibromin 1